MDVEFIGLWLYCGSMLTFGKCAMDINHGAMLGKSECVGLIPMGGPVAMLSDSGFGAVEDEALFSTFVFLFWEQTLSVKMLEHLFCASIDMLL